VFPSAAGGLCSGDALPFVGIPNTLDNGVANVAVNQSGVCMRVTLNGSGAIDNIDVTTLPILARITGGGWTRDADIPNSVPVRSSRGLTLHCDITLSNNLELNWRDPDEGRQKWHINKVVDFAFCRDDPSFEPNPPDAPADTFIGVDLGKLNNTEETIACWVFEDHGEPGTADRALIRVFAYDTTLKPGDFDLSGDDPCKVVDIPPTSSNTVLYVPLGLIEGGNLQFHFDQPHKKNGS